MFSSGRQIFLSLKRIALIGVLVLVTDGSPALAGGAMSWNCDRPNGQYDTRNLPVPPRSTSISGWVVVHKADFRPDWNSVAKITFMQSPSNDGNCHCSGMEVVAFHNPDKVEVHLVANGIDQAMAQTTFEDPINFRISVDEHGSMTLDLGKTQHMTKSVGLAHPGHDALAMSCSGIDISFNDIVVE